MARHAVSVLLITQRSQVQILPPLPKKCRSEARSGQIGPGLFFHVRTMHAWVAGGWPGTAVDVAGRGAADAPHFAPAVSRRGRSICSSGRARSLLVDVRDEGVGGDAGEPTYVDGLDLAVGQ